MVDADVSARQRLIASPAWPAPMTTAVVAAARGAQATSTLTLVGLVMMS